MLARKLLAQLIRLYQHTVSPDHSAWGRRRYPYGYCRFYPSCSEYARQTLENQSFPRSSALILWRLVRCNPFYKGGIDQPQQ